MDKSFPAEIAKLISLHGGVIRDAEKASGNPGAFHKIRMGKRPFSDATKAKVLAAIEVKEGGAPSLAPQKEAPAFVPWKGKKVSVKIAALGGKTRTLKAPEPVAQLITANDGVVTRAAKAMGYSTGTALFQIMEGKSEFNEKKQRLIHAALNGLPLPGRETMGEELDECRLGIAIVLTKTAGFDRIADIADIMNAKPVFKKNTAIGWLLIFKLTGREELTKFKRLASRDATDIVLP